MPRPSEPTPHRAREGAAHDGEVAASLAALVESTRPLVIGVRHHSPALAAALPHLLQRFAPERVLVELPAEFAHWLPWLGSGDLQAPVALAAVQKDGPGLWFYPFADFSPELAAVRWAVANGVPVEPFDLPAGARIERATASALAPYDGGEDDRPAAVLDRLHDVTRTDDFESLWDRLVEVHAPGQAPEAVRRAALYVGWALRRDSVVRGELADLDRMRETYMRERLDRLGAYGGAQRIAVVVGAFHGPALLERPELFEPLAAPGEVEDVVTSLVPYAFELLDSRSGYPAGIRDPMWQQRIWQALSLGGAVDEVVADAIVTICRHIRATGHVAGVPDADAAMRMANNLAALRGLTAPGRQELVEAIGSALGRGEPLGRARVLAGAMERALVGRRRGRLARGTPRSGLYPHVLELLGELRLPGPGAESAEPAVLRLDPMRSDLDRRRHVALQRLCACGIPYGSEQEGRAVGAGETLTRLWSVRWEPGTEAMLEVASLWGVRLEQAATGALERDEHRLRTDEKWTAAAMLEGTRRAAECGLVALTVARLRALEGPFLEQADLAHVLQALALVEQIERGHIPGFDAAHLAPGAVEPEAGGRTRRSAFLAAAVRALEGVVGSDDLRDASALVELVLLFQNQDREDALGHSRIAWLVGHIADEGSPLMQGAGCAAHLLMAGEAAGDEAVERFAGRLGSWVDAAVTPEALRDLARRLRGTLAAAGPLLEASPACMASLVERVERLPDAEFLRRLPHLRDGFSVLSPADRSRFLATLADAFPASLDPRGHRHALTLDASPQLYAAWAGADVAGVQRLREFDLLEVLDVAPDARPARKPEEGVRTDTEPVAASQPAPPHQLDPPARWRLILGRERERLTGVAQRAAVALDELYGAGRGEGAHGELGGGGGQEPAYPTSREWADALEELFGRPVRDEVLGRAVELGRSAAILELDAETVTPSVELLEQVLSLRGSLSEAQLGRMRRLVERVVAALVNELANQVRPALTGLLTPRPTRRRGGPVDLRRTIERNLEHARPGEDGGWQLVPQNIYFKTRAKPSTDWHVVLVVDVSGSMEPSTIYSALMAAIFASLPSVAVSFLAFNTEVIDLSDHVADPLSLLLEVQVGGGTHIARGLAYARTLVRVPQRTLVVLVSDFEEGWEVTGLVREVRELVESGVRALGVAALDDVGKPRFNRAIAEMVAGVGMPVAALTPLELARWVGERIHGQ